ncbi:hypothetical protein [Nocardioides panaciterrulae]|uniref:AbiTii domain-containing protein n=1 Tax=Nocardioides panaciterrulae TaxID=661492 RepID=A0A7Y9E357_9ACTN|nr:hypothetical protein [Nocardioides panaciterrulae]NYD40066.1 hypothetical protein [Nocardioides panaciterrulae]
MLEQIEEGALDSKSSLADVLRKCVALGGRSGSEQLRDWARRELDGYPPAEELPGYRTVGAIIAIDGANLAYKVTGQQISPSDLPEFARESIKQEAAITQGVAEIERLAATQEEVIRIQHSAMPDLVTYMNSQQDDVHVNGTILAMYWKVTPSALYGILDTIRTNLVALVAEMRAAGVDDVPPAEVANQAVQVVVHNAKRSQITVNANQASGGVGGSQEITTPPSAEHASLPGWVRGPWAVVLGLATIAGGVGAIAVWLDWTPFT